MLKLTSKFGLFLDWSIVVKLQYLLKSACCIKVKWFNMTQKATPGMSALFVWQQSVRASVRALRETEIFTVFHKNT